MTKNNNQKNKTLIIIIILFVLFITAIILAGMISLFALGSDTEGFGNVALIPIKGVITTDSVSGMFSSEVSDSSEIVKMIEKADQNPSIKAMIFEINSPGGSPVATDEIASAIKKTNKTTVAWIRAYGASGAYWIASSCDHIVANKMSITGSVGVISSYLEFAEFFEQYNVTYRRLVSGSYKDLGDPFRELSEPEEVILQNKIDKIHGFFIEEVVKNRRLTESQKEEISSGIFYLGIEAKELNLIDELGNKDNAVTYIEEKENITVKLVSYKTKKSFLQLLNELSNEQAFFMGRGISFIPYMNFGRQYSLE